MEKIYILFLMSFNELDRFWKSYKKINILYGVFIYICIYKVGIVNWYENKYSVC